MKAFNIGDHIRVMQVPPLVLEQCPSETIEIFNRCVGQTLRVDGFDTYGHLELNVMDSGLQAPDYCHHTIWIEPECVELIHLNV